MSRRTRMICLVSWLAMVNFYAFAEHADHSTPAGHDSGVKKPSPDAVMTLLKEGNERFTATKATHPHADATRLKLAGSSNQGDFCLATVLTCSDSRVPVESIFDAGVMDIFVVRVAGNVCGEHELGSMEYGVAHVNTPVLIVMGHTQCGAVTAATNRAKGHPAALERNIPCLIKDIEPAVKRAIAADPKLEGAELIQRGIEENVWQGIENLFKASPRVRELVNKEKLKVVGAIYDVGTGRVLWLSELKIHRILGRVEADPLRLTEAMADESAWTTGYKPQPRAHAEAIHEPSAHGSTGNGNTAKASTAQGTAHQDHSSQPTETVNLHGGTPKPAAPADPHAAPAAHGASAAPKHDDPIPLPHGVAASVIAHGATGDTGHGAHGASGATGGTGDEHGASVESKVPWKLVYGAGGVCLLGIVIMIVGMMRSKVSAVVHPESISATTQMISPPTSIETHQAPLPTNVSH